MDEINIHAENIEFDELESEFKKAGISCVRARKMGRSAIGNLLQHLEIKDITDHADVICTIILAVALKLQKTVYLRTKGKDVELKVQNYSADDAGKILGAASDIIIKKRN
jgi:hypothetical protein